MEMTGEKGKGFSWNNQKDISLPIKNIRKKELCLRF